MELLVLWFYFIKTGIYTARETGLFGVTLSATMGGMLPFGKQSKLYGEIFVHKNGKKLYFQKA